MPPMHHWVQMSLGGILFGVHDNQWSIADLALKWNLWWGNFLATGLELLSMWCAAAARIKLIDKCWQTCCQWHCQCPCSAVWGSRQDNRHIIVTYVLLHALLSSCLLSIVTHVISLTVTLVIRLTVTLVMSLNIVLTCPVTCQLSVVSSRVPQLPSHLASVTGNSHQLSCYSGSLCSHNVYTLWNEQMAWFWVPNESSGQNRPHYWGVHFSVVSSRRGPSYFWDLQAQWNDFKL